MAGQDPFFEADIDRVKRLTLEKSVATFRRLLWAEATRLRVPLSQVHISEKPYTADGGIDASVDHSNVVSGGLFEGRTRFQLKSGASFKPWTKTSLRSAIFKKKKRRNAPRELNDGVRTCLERSDRYVIVAFGHDLPDNKRTDSVALLRKLFSEVGFPSAKCDVWGAGEIRSYLNEYPSLCLNLMGRHDLGMCSHGEWRARRDMQGAYFPGEKQRDLIESIRASLRATSQQPIRVVGDAGVGKTRLMLEATEVDDLEPLVVYFENGDRFLDSNLFNFLQRKDIPLSAIVVIDECRRSDFDFFADRLVDNARLRLVALDHDPSRFHQDVYRVPPLSTDRILEIFRSHQLPIAVAQSYAPGCGGSPRLAHLVAESLSREELESPLVVPAVADVFERSIHGGDERTGAQAEERRRVVRHIALFERLGYSGHVEGEAKLVADIADIRWRRFQEIVDSLRKKGVVQGENTIYLTPKLLHIHYWREWWEIYGRSEDVSALLARFNGNSELLKWFAGMFVYARESGVASAIVAELLGSDGPFAAGDLLETRAGARFFESLAEAKPPDALRCLERTVAQWDDARLQSWKHGRQSVVFALQKMAYVRECFSRAAKLLLRLAEVENESIFANNSTGVFVDLFSPGIGPLASTSAPPAERLPVLEFLAASDRPIHRELFLKASSKALKRHVRSRMHGAETRGLVVETGWVPESPDELWNYYQRVWTMLMQMRETEEDPDKKQWLEEVLIKSANGMLDTPLFEDVIAFFEELTVQQTAPDSRVVQAIARALSFPSPQQSNVRERLKKLMNSLENGTLGRRLRRTVAMTSWDERRSEDAERRFDERLARLADDSLANIDEFVMELGWLSTDEAAHAYPFGALLAERDRERRLLAPLVDALESAGPKGAPLLLAGYLSVVEQQSPDVWEEVLEEMSHKEQLACHVPEATWRSGFSRSAIERVTKVVRSGCASPEVFGLWRFGRDLEKFSTSEITEWLEILLEASSPSEVANALELAEAYERLSNRVLDGPLLKCLLSHDVFFAETRRNAEASSDRVLLHWREMFARLRATHPELALDVFQRGLSSVADLDGIMQSRIVRPALVELIRIFPSRTWDCIAEILESSDLVACSTLTRWLRGSRSGDECGQNFMPLFPRDVVMDWAERDRVDRAPELAEAAPSTFEDAGGGGFTRELLIRFGDLEDVHSCLLGNFITETFHGSKSEHYARRLSSVDRWLAAEHDSRVRKWLIEFRDYLESKVDEAKLEEERIVY